METIDYHKQIFNLIHSNKLNITVSSIEIPFSDKAMQAFETLGIEAEKAKEKGEDIIVIYQQKIPIRIYTKEDFLSTSKEIEPHTNLLILNQKEDDQYSYINGKVYTNFIKDTKNFFFSNTTSYLMFKAFLEDGKNDDFFHFVDFFDGDAQRILFSSISEQGRLLVKYHSELPDLDIRKNYSPNFIAFKNCFRDKNQILPKFLKDALIKVGLRFEDDENRLVQIFLQLNQIVNKARINFEIYLSNLSMDKIRGDYDELKTKYLSDISGIVSKLTQKVLGLPIGLSATLFAASRVKEEPLFLVILACAIIISSMYLTSLLKVHYDDLITLKKMFLTKYESLEENNFFKKYPNEIKSFQDIKDKLIKRVAFLKKWIILSYFWIVNISNIVVVGYIISQLGFSLFFVVLVSLALLTILAVVKNNVLEQEK